MLGGLGNIGKMMEQVKEMQKQAEEVKLRLDSISVQGISPNKTVNIRMSGNRKLVDLALNDGFEALSIEEKQFALYTAFTEALERAERINESEMKSVAGSMMPSLGNLFGK